MEESVGFPWKVTKVEKTKILPLRWFANLCEKPASYHLDMVMHYDDRNNYGIAFKFHSKLSNIFYKPYFKWGTFYKLDIDKSEQS